MQIIKKNCFYCKKCKKVVESKFRHQFATCDCDPPNFTDGGLDYIRRGGNFDDVEDRSIIDDTNTPDN